MTGVRWRNGDRHEEPRASSSTITRSCARAGAADQPGAGSRRVRRGGGGDAALEAIAAPQPDIVVVDISLHGPDGLELLKIIRAIDEHLPVLVLSMHDESIYAERALRAGANGYIMKQEATENVLVALRRILRRRGLRQRSCGEPHAAADTCRGPRGRRSRRSRA